MRRFTTRVEWRDEYEIHYSCTPDGGAPAEGPIVVYFPIKEEAFASNFIPTPGLTDRHSPDFAPTAHRVSIGATVSSDYFTVASDGIRSSNPHVSGLTAIIERLLETGGFEHVFHPIAPPPIRWENVQLTELSLPGALDVYCEALRKEYCNGFVEARRYRIESGDFEDAVIAFKRYSWTPVQFLETLRHPKIKADFGITTLDGDCLLSRVNWRQFSPFLFSGFLAETLAYGGAYSSHPSSSDAISRALRIADDVFAEFHRNYYDLELNICHKPWCPRFCDIAWDHTWIIFEPSSRMLTILLASDTD